MRINDPYFRHRIANDKVSSVLLWIENKKKKTSRKRSYLHRNIQIPHTHVRMST